MGITFKTLSSLAAQFRKTHVTAPSTTQRATTELLKFPAQKLEDTVTISVRHLNPRETKKFIKESKELLRGEIATRLGLKTKADYKNPSTLTNGTFDGSYNVLSNEITLPTEILTNPKAVRVYGIQNGKKVALNNGIKFEPFILDSIDDFTKHKAEIMESTGITDFKFQALSIEERKKVFLQRLFHEARHQRQFELMIQTEGIGYTNTLEIELSKLSSERSRKLWKIISDTTWKTMKAKNEGSIKRDSRLGELSNKFFEGHKNYNRSDTMGTGYADNILEKDAFLNAYRYIKEKFGEWEGLILL